MKTIITIGLSALAFTFAGTASAGEGSGAYVNVGAALYDVDAEVIGIVGRIGYNATENFGVEGEASFGINDDSGFEVKSSFSGFGVARLPMGKRSNVFARVGYHTTKFGYGNSSGSDDGVAWGIGGNYMFTDKNGIRVDYTRYEIGSGGVSASSDTIAVAFVRKF